MPEHFDKKSILTKQATALELALEQINIKRLNSIPFIQLWSWQDCPLEFLPYLAWATGVFYWDDRWSENQKRKICRKAILNGRKMSSLSTLKDVLRNTGYGDAIILKARQLPKTDEGYISDTSGIYTVDAPDSWATYWIIVREIITPQKAAMLRKLAEGIQQAHSILAEIRIENVGIMTDMELRTDQGWATDGSFKEVA